MEIFQQNVVFRRSMFIKPQTAVEVFKQNLFQQDCEQFHIFTVTIYIQLQSISQFYIVDLQEALDAKEEDYHKYCRKQGQSYKLEIKPQLQDLFSVKKILIDNGKFCEDVSEGKEQVFDIQTKIMLQNNNTSFILYIGLLIVLNMIISIAILLLRKKKEKQTQISQMKVKQLFLDNQNFY